MPEENIPPRLTPPPASDEWGVKKKAYRGKKKWGVRIHYQSLWGERDAFWDNWYATEKQREDAMIGLNKNRWWRGKLPLERIER